MANLSDVSKNFSVSYEFYHPKEKLLEIEKSKKKLVIGLPREDYKGENRICLTPLTVEMLVNNGHEIFIETGAGLASNYADCDYSEKGAFIVCTKAEIYQCDIVLQMSPLSSKEIDLLKGNQIIMSALQVHCQCAENIRKLMQKKVTAIAFEYLKDSDGHFPVVRSMSEIIGISAIMIAGEYLSKGKNGKGVLLGGVTGVSPTEVVILGAGTAAEYASRAAIGLGASIKVFDNSMHQLRRLKAHLGQQIHTSTFHPSILSKAFKSADVVIGALKHEDSHRNILVTEDMIKQMKTGSVIVDLSIAQGGCFETSKMTTHEKPTFTKYGVIHYCVPNLASHTCRTASIAMSNICAPLLLDISNNGGVHQFLKSDMGLRHGTYIYKGILTNKRLGDCVKIQAKDINLFFTSM